MLSTSYERPRYVESSDVSAENPIGTDLGSVIAQPEDAQSARRYPLRDRKPQDREQTCKTVSEIKVTYM